MTSKKGGRKFFGFLVGTALAFLFSGQASYAGLLANWNFDDGTLADSSGNGMSLTRTPESGSYHSGTLRYLENGSGKALSTSNVSAYVDLKDMGQLDNYTVSMWVDATGINWDNYWTFRGSSDTSWNDGQAGLRFQSYANDRMRWVFCVKNPTTGSNVRDFLFQASEADDTGGYNHLVWAVADGKVVFYLNGLEKFTLTDSPILFSTNMGLFSLAGSVLQNSGDNRNMIGNFDNVAVYNRALKAEEVTAIHASGSATDKLFADIYSRNLSGVDGKWSDIQWKHQLGETGTVTENQSWTNYSQVRLGSSENATLAIDQEVFISKITVDTTDSVDLTTGRILTLQGGFAGNGGLELLGNGTLILSGISTYTGDTRVASNAMLQLDGSISNSALKLEKNASLTGSDAFSMKSLEAVSGSHILLNVDAEGMLAPLHIGEDATLGEGVLDFVFSGDFADVLGVSSLDILQAQNVVMPENKDLLLADSWRGKLELTLMEGLDGSAVLRVNVAAAYVPEPSSWVLGLLGICGGVWYLKKRKNGDVK